MTYQIRIQQNQKKSSMNPESFHQSDTEYETTIQNKSTNSAGKRKRQKQTSSSISAIPKQLTRLAAKRIHTK